MNTRNGWPKAGVLAGWAAVAVLVGGATLARSDRLVRVETQVQHLVAELGTIKQEVSDVHNAVILIAAKMDIDLEK